MRAIPADSPIMLGVSGKCMCNLHNMGGFFVGIYIIDVLGRSEFLFELSVLFSNMLTWECVAVPHFDLIYTGEKTSGR